MLSSEDSHWMAQALRLAELGLYSTSPNPRVGCVLVAHGRIIGSGWHRQAGEAHAEVYALREAGGAARGSTAYVTMEPCSHHGRTPPCADALISAGVARVVTAAADPNPLVAGSGNNKLRAAGLQVDTGLMEAVALELNVGFYSRMNRGTPWLRSKIGLSLDGRTALANGVSKWITGESARHDVQHWRARSCAVLTGIGTVLADDARLNVREPRGARQPLRVVLDSNLRISETARIFFSTKNSNVLVYTASRDNKKISLLNNAGASVCVLPDGNGRIDLPGVMRDLAQRGCNEVLVEAGSTLNGALLQAGLTDELLLYIAPQLLGDLGRGMFKLGELGSLDQRVNLKWHDMRQVGPDLRIMARVENV